jgi:hypothetical protein
MLYDPEFKYLSHKIKFESFPWSGTTEYFGTLFNTIFSDMCLDSDSSLKISESHSIFLPSRDKNIFVAFRIGQLCQEARFQNFQTANIIQTHIREPNIKESAKIFHYSSPSPRHGSAHTGRFLEFVIGLMYLVDFFKIKGY